MQGTIQSALFNGATTQTWGLMLTNALNFSLPAKFDEFLCQELMITLD